MRVGQIITLGTEGERRNVEEEERVTGLVPGKGVRG